MTPVAPVAAQSDDEAEPRLVSIGTAITQLRREAQQGLAGERWPRSWPDFAEQMNWRVDNTSAVQALGQRLHANPAADAYIKWQLLGFGVGMTDVNASMLEQIQRHVPMPAAAPRRSAPPTDSEPLVVHTAECAAGNCPHIRPPKKYEGAPPMSLYTINQLSQIRGRGQGLPQSPPPDFSKDVLREQALAQAAKANYTIHAFRAALAEALPIAGGARMSMMIQDVRDRIHAADPSCRDVMKRLLRLAAAHVHDSTLTADVRQSLIADARTLALIRKGRVRVDITDVEALVEHLGGKPTQAP